MLTDYYDQGRGRLTECGGDGLPPAGGAGLPAGGPGRAVAGAGAGAGSRLLCSALTALLRCSIAVAPRPTAHCLAGARLTADRLAADRLAGDRLAGDRHAGDRFPTARLLWLVT